MPVRARAYAATVRVYGGHDACLGLTEVGAMRSPHALGALRLHNLE